MVLAGLARKQQKRSDEAKGNTVSTERKQLEIWIEQCDAARTINERYGLKAAFDYIVGEKLMNHADAASRHPHFARSLLRFVSEVRRMFAAEDLCTNLARLERELREETNEEDIEVFPESPAVMVERVERFTVIQELLTAEKLGTS
jgi:hypothetical protein